MTDVWMDVRDGRNKQITWFKHKHAHTRKHAYTHARGTRDIDLCRCHAYLGFSPIMSSSLVLPLIPIYPLINTSLPFASLILAHQNINTYPEYTQWRYYHCKSVGQALVSSRLDYTEYCTVYQTTSRGYNMHRTPWLTFFLELFTALMLRLF